MVVFLLGAWAGFVIFLLRAPGKAMKFLAALLGIPFGLLFVLWLVLYITQPFA